jgi:hypothetical protein
MSKEQVMDYVMNSPANTNPNVLSGMLDGISGTQLPSPTESDNGKVLGVDGGEYKLVEQSGGGLEHLLDGEADGSLRMNTARADSGDTKLGEGAVALGASCFATGDNSFAEGYGTNATFYCAHAEGQSCRATAQASHAEGLYTFATGKYSHAQNAYSNAQGYAQTVIGEYNKPSGNPNSRQDTDYAFIIGNGDEERTHNAFAIRWDGGIVLADGTVLTVAQLKKIASLT